MRYCQLNRREINVPPNIDNEPIVSSGGSNAVYAIGGEFTEKGEW